MNSELSFDLEPAKKFFTDAIRLTLTMAEKNNVNKTEPLIKVPVDTGECVKTVLYEEYKGVVLQKFYVEKNTEFKWKKINPEQACHGFILLSGDMEVSSKDLQLTINLPKDKHFFYIKNGDDVYLRFNENTWFYVISLPNTCI